MMSPYTVEYCLNNEYDSNKEGKIKTNDQLSLKITTTSLHMELSSVHIAHSKCTDSFYRNTTAALQYRQSWKSMMNVLCGLSSADFLEALSSAPNCLSDLVDIVLP